MIIRPSSSNRRGLSTVGSILMVAVLVVLATVVGAFTFGLTPGLGENVNAAVAVDATSDSFEVMVNDMGNADRIIVESPTRTVELAGVGETASMGRTGCRMTVYGVHDGQRRVLTSFHASVPDGSSGDLASYWAFEDCQLDGTQLTDATGKKTGTLEGDVTTGVAGVSGDAFSFDGYDDRVVVGSRGEFEDMTVSVWVKPSESDGWIAGNGAKWRIRDIASEDRFQFWIREEGFGQSTTVAGTARR